MKLTLKIDTPILQEIDIEFPYYYKHDLCFDESDVVIYGKITETHHVSISWTNRDTDHIKQSLINPVKFVGRFGSKVEIKIERIVNHNGLASYILPHLCKSSFVTTILETEYNSAKDDALEFIKLS